MKLPAVLTLPSGRRVALDVVRPPVAPPRRPEGAPLWGEVLALFERGDVVLREDGRELDVMDLALGDFHLVRALLTKAGVLEEEEVVVPCRNCEAEIRLRPCAALEIAPWVDGELGDQELDATFPFGEPHELAPPVPLGRVRLAKTIVLRPRTVREARPAFAALAHEMFQIDAKVVEALGIEALGPETDAERIADALASCDEAAFGAMSAVFLASHYPLRLGAVAFCAACGARNDVDAPYDRELALGTATTREAAAARVFPDLDTFAARARALAAPMLEDLPGEPVELVVEGGTPAVDDGGEPLLGSYVPPHPGDMASPSRPPTVTVYHRTFLAMWNEEGPYDWEAELHETIEHELEHHEYFLRGEDPMDDEERAVIREEGVRLVGRREANRRALGDFRASITDFARRTWPLLLLLVIAFVATLLTQRP